MLTGVESMYFTYFRQTFTPTENCWRRDDYEKVGPSSELNECNGSAHHRKRRMPSRSLVSVREAKSLRGFSLPSLKPRLSICLAAALNRS
jgi:hypothetical protein